MSKVNYVASYTATAEASINDVWALWADVNNWDKWDNGIEKAVIKQNFKAGNTFSLTPQGGKPLDVTLTSVVAGEEFADEAVLPFGVIRNFHRINKDGKKLQLTHEVRAEINEDAAGFFDKEIWPHMQAGLPESVRNIIAIAQEA